MESLVLSNQKTCSSCNLPYSLDFFHKDKCQKDGRKTQCKLCKSKYSKNHNSTQLVKERSKLVKRSYYLENSEKERQYRVTHKVRINQLQRDWYLNHKDSLRDKRRVYSNTRCEYDINFKLRKNLRSRLYNALKDNLKTGSAVQDLGCSVAKLKIYLQLKFTRRP